MHIPLLLPYPLEITKPSSVDQIYLLLGLIIILAFATTDSNGFGYI